MSDLNGLITQVSTNLEAFVNESKTYNGDVKNAIGTLQSRIEELDKRMSADPTSTRNGGSLSKIAHDIATKMAAGVPFGTSWAIPSPTVALEGKALTSSGLVAADGSGAPIGTYGGYRAGQIRALFRSIPTSGDVFNVVETGTAGWGASPQTTEGDTKHESTASLSASSIPISTVASWISISKQAQQDVAGLSAFIENRLFWALATKLDLQIFAGDGLSGNLSGLTGSAASFDTATYLSAGSGWELVDIVASAACQVRVNGFEPDFVLLNPVDALRMRLAKNSTGDYLTLPPLPRIVESTAVAAGAFMVGDSRGALLRPRHEAVLDVSESHSDFFARNLIALRIEERLALQVLSGQAFVYGSLSTSPA